MSWTALLFARLGFEDDLRARAFAVTESCRDTVWDLVRQAERFESINTARGYIRARAGSIVRRHVKSWSDQPRGAEHEKLVQLALDELVDTFATYLIVPPGGSTMRQAA